MYLLTDYVYILMYSSVPGHHPGAVQQTLLRLTCFGQLYIQLTRLGCFSLKERSP